LFYADAKTSAHLSLQNSKNFPVEVGIKIVYGTGAPGTPNGVYDLPSFTLAGQQRIETDLKQFLTEMEGANWGSIVVTAPPQTIAAHTVMRSAENGLAFSSEFVDPSLSAGTTKVADMLKLEYDTSVTPCIMVCNTSAADTRTVTATFETDNGVAIPTSQLTLGPGQQQMIVLDPHQLLSPGQSSMADARLTYSGNASDIMAGAVSMSASDGCAISAAVAEPSASDGKQLMSPFFKMDARTQGIVQISNLGTSQVRAGVSLKLANSGGLSLTTDLISVPAHATRTLDLQQYFDQVPDGVAAEGCLALIHNGPAGSVTGSFMLLTSDPVESTLRGGTPPPGFVVFPTSLTVQPAEGATLSVVSPGGGAPTWTASGSGGSIGTVVGEGSPDPDVWTATYTSPDDGDEADTVTIQVASATGTGTVSIEIQKVKLKSIQTFSGQVDTGGRLNPDGGTSFILTGKKDFPAVELQVRFQEVVNGSTQFVAVDIPVDSEHRPSPTQLSGMAPSNNLFIRDVKIQVRTLEGAKVSKKTLCEDGCSAYYSFDPPTPTTSISVPGFNRLGGNLTITAAGGGIRQFQPSDHTLPNVNPKVDLGPIDFEVNFVNPSTPGTPSTINGNVQRAGPDVRSCQSQGQAPCYSIRVTNPGGRKIDRVQSNVPLYTLLPGPPPSPHGRHPDNGQSIGGTIVTIVGENMDFTDSVSVGGNIDLLPLISKSKSEVMLATLPHVAGPTGITVFDIDGAAPNGTAVPNGNFTYTISPVTLILGVYVVGPNEGIEREGPITVSTGLSCLTNVTLDIEQVPPPLRSLTGVVAVLANGSYNCANGSCVGFHSGTISYTLRNFASPMNERLKKTVTVTRQVSYTGVGTCTGTF
jgi:hypothetical protein